MHLHRYKILFYGASVTAQSDGNGFFNYLPKLENIDFDRFAMGGCHFNDAGFFLQNKIIESKPDICILDWNSTGQKSFEESKIRFLVSNLISHKIVPAFIIFPNKDGNLKFDRDAERQVYEIASLFNLNILDLRNINFIDCLRDSVHTHSYGANQYALDIYEWIGASIEGWKKFFLKFGSSILDWPEYRDHEIRSLTYSENLKVVNSLRIELQSISTRKIEILISGTIGPYSPVVDILESGNFIRRMQIWDPWCYYERTSYSTLGVFKPSNYKDDILVVDISVRKDAPDYSISRQLDFMYQDERFLSLSGIYVDNAEILNVKVL